MYAISSALSRKLIGTRTRPQPLTPKNDVNSRAEFCETIAMRSPARDAERVEAGRLRPRPPGDLAPGHRAPRRCRLVGFVDDPVPVAVDELGPVEEVVDGQRHAHAGPLRLRLHRGPLRVVVKAVRWARDGQCETITVLAALVALLPAASNATLLI